MKTEIVRARIESHIKDEATQVLDAMELSVSDAIRILFARIAEDKAFPFDRRRMPSRDARIELSKPADSH